MTRRTRRSRQEGVVAILVIMLMAGLIGIAAYAVDTGHLLKVRTELQNVADASALAAAKELDGTSVGIAAASAMVQSQSALNNAYNGGQEVADADIEFGNWSTSASTFTSFGSEPTEGQAATANAVRVTARRGTRGDDGDVTGTAVHTPFFGFLRGSYTDTPVNASATAVGGGPLTECAFPMVVADCQFEAMEGDGCGLCFQMANNNDDNTGWTAMNNTPQNDPNSIGQAIQAACYTDGAPDVDPDTHQCPGDCSTQLDDTLCINNGNFFNAGGGNGNANGLTASSGGGSSKKGGSSLAPGGNNGNGGNGNGNGSTGGTGTGGAGTGGGAGSGGTGAGSGGSGGNGNGNNTNPCTTIEDILNRDGTPEYFSVKIPVIKSEAETCDGTQYSGCDHPIVGYAWLDIYGVDCGNSSDAVIDPDYPETDCAPPSDSYVLAVLRCDYEDSDQVGGGSFTGMRARRMRLVQ